MAHWLESLAERMDTGSAEAHITDHHYPKLELVKLLENMDHMVHIQTRGDT